MTLIAWPYRLLALIALAVAHNLSNDVRDNIAPTA